MQKYIKDFDGWNVIKKETNRNTDRLFYHKREVRWCRLGTNVGFEQDGTGKDYARPVLILKDFNQHVCWVVPLTTSTKDNPFHIALGKMDEKESFAIISQLRLVDTKRLDTKLGVVNKEIFDKIRKAIKDML